MPDIPPHARPNRRMESESMLVIGCLLLIILAAIGVVSLVVIGAASLMCGA